jgi:hypothetical protein
MLVLACLAPALLGQVKGDSPASDRDATKSRVVRGFFDVVEVEVVNIDVWVTDGDGNPYSGLGRDDFVVLRDGRPVAVSPGNPSPTTWHVSNADSRR